MRAGIVTVGVLSFLFLICSGAWAEQYRELLEQFRPHLYASFGEFSPPIAVEEMLSRSYLIDLQRQELVTDGTWRAVQPSLENLSQYDSERYCVKLMEDYTELFADSTEDNFAKSPPVVYARAKRLAGSGLIALQYFFFYPGSYSGKILIGPQLKWHEGDTEYAQILIDEDSREIYGASTSIHYYGSSYPASQLHYGEDGRVKMYIAKKSHATYLHPSSGRGHQAMEGNLGFGGNLLISLRTVWDHCSEDIELDYELRCPGEDALVFKWRGRWGGDERVHPLDEKSAKSHELGPVSFAYRNAMSERLSMWNDPEYFYSFYYMPSDFYQKLLLSIKEIEDQRLLDEIFDVIYHMGRLRIQVETLFREKYHHTCEKDQRLLCEAVPFVVVSMWRERISEIAELGRERLGESGFIELMGKIAAKNLKIIVKSIVANGLDIRDIIEDPLIIYTIEPAMLLSLLASMTELSKESIVDIYARSHRLRNGNPMGFSKFEILHSSGGESLD